MSDVIDKPRMSVDAMIESYVKVRDKKKLIEERHKQELMPYTETMNQLEGYLLEAMNQTGLDSMKGAHGTAFKSTRRSAVVREWTATLDFIRDNQAWDLLEARVAKTRAFAIIEETEAPIPGVETSVEVIVNVRRAGEKPAVGK